MLLAADLWWPAAVVSDEQRSVPDTDGGGGHANIRQCGVGPAAKTWNVSTVVVVRASSPHVQLDAQISLAAE